MVIYKSIKVNAGCGHQLVYKDYGNSRIEQLSPIPSQKIYNTLNQTSFLLTRFNPLFGFY